jgi:hypothetical protein
VGTYRQQKRLCFIAVLLQPSGGFIDDERCGVAFEFADRFTVADKVDGVLVAGCRVVLCGKPPVVAMIIRLGLGGFVEGWFDNISTGCEIIAGSAFHNSNWFLGMLQELLLCENNFCTDQ